MRVNMQYPSTSIDTDQNRTDPTWIQTQFLFAINKHKNITEKKKDVILLPTDSTRGQLRTKK